MTEHTTEPHDASAATDADALGSAAEQQQQEEERTRTEERLSMDASDMTDAIHHEEDQKFDSDPETRYDAEVEEALPDDAR